METVMIKNETIMSPQETVQMRETFANQYCTSKGWDRQNLTMEQILEIRSCVQWKNPHLIVS